MNSTFEYKDCDPGWIPCTCELLCMVSTIFLSKYYFSKFPAEFKSKKARAERRYEYRKLNVIWTRTTS